MNIQLHIVAPSERREQVRREIVRPVFSVMERASRAMPTCKVKPAIRNAPTENLEHIDVALIDSA